MVDATLVVAIFGGVAVLGYLSNLIFEKTRVPDALWLILFGVLVAWLGAVPANGLIAFAPVLATLAVAVMGFEFGLHTDLRTITSGLPRTSVLAVVTFLFSMVGVGLVSHALLGLDLVRALLLGAIVSNVSSTPVEELLYRVRMKDELRNFLQLEATLSDLLCFGAAAVLIGIYSVASAVNPLQAIGSGFIIGILVGAVVGALRLAGSRFIKGKPYNYVLTLGLALVAYAVTEWIAGIGTIGAVVYGLVLANAKRLPRKAGTLREYKASPFLKKFYSEISLFLRAFFFVLLGMLALGAFDGGWWYGVAILAALVLLRMPAVEFALVRKSVTRQELWLMKGMIPKDLSTVVMVLFAISKGVVGADGWLSIVFVVVVGSVLYATAMTLIIMREQLAAKAQRVYNYDELPDKKPRLWKKYGEG